LQLLFAHCSTEQLMLGFAFFSILKKPFLISISVYEQKVRALCQIIFPQFLNNIRVFANDLINNLPMCKIHDIYLLRN